MTKQTVPVPENEKGLYLRGQVWWYRWPMVSGVQRVPATLQTEDKEEAKRRRAELVALPDLATAGSVVQEVELHLVDMRATGKYTDATVRAKRGVLRRFARELPRGLKPESVTTRQIKTFYQSSLEGRTPGTVHKQWMDVRAFFTWLVTRKKLRVNPAVEGVEDVRPARPIRLLFCEMELMDQLVKNCPRSDLQLVLMLGFHAGLRHNEILHAVWDWFDFRNNVVNVCDTPWKKFNKTKKARKLPMRTELREYLLNVGCDPSVPFLVRPDVKPGKGVYRWYFEQPMKEYLATQMWEGENCLWVTAHVMRHTFVSLLAQQGNLSIWEIAQAAGNTEEECRLVYAHLNPKYRNIELVRKQPAALAA